MNFYGLFLSNIDASKGNRGDDRKFGDRPLVKDRRTIKAVDCKEKSIARRKHERASRRITRAHNG
jgi:hypothetical protein